MRHLKKRTKLNKQPAHVSAIMKNLAKSLITHNRIKTTKAKARMVKPFVEKLITKSKNNTLHSKRIVASTLGGWDVIEKLFSEIAVKFKDRPGGYTRILKIGYRDSDGSEMVQLEFVEDFSVSKKTEPKKAEAKPEKKEKPKKEKEDKSKK